MSEILINIFSFVLNNNVFYDLIWHILKNILTKCSYVSMKIMHIKIITNKYICV